MKKEDTTQLETATLAGGCFWCTEAIFKRLKGINKVTAGYTGGHDKNPTYYQVAEEKTGHAEAIQIMFDPNIISYKKLLEVFFHLHDPTTLNRQNYDVGTDYRSAIFYHNEEQHKTAEVVKHEIEQAKLYSGKIVTEISPVTQFYPAEEEHQNFYEKNTYAPYCQVIIDPKLRKLFKEYKEDIKPEYKET